MRRVIVPVVLASLAAACATTAGPGAPLAERTAALSMHDFMKQVIDPAANIVFAAGNDPEEGTTDAALAARWREAIEAAGVLQESGRILLMPGRAVNDPEWTRTAQLMVDAGADASAAAGARDVEAAFEAGGKLYDSCNGCHAKFIHGRQ